MYKVELCPSPGHDAVWAIRCHNGTLVGHTYHADIARQFAVSGDIIIERNDLLRERDAAIRQRDRLREACMILRSLYPQSNGKGWDDMDTALAACEKEAE